MSYDAWLEKPYVEQGRMTEFHEWAVEQGYCEEDDYDYSPDDYWDDMVAERADSEYSRMKDEGLI